MIYFPSSKKNLIAKVVGTSYFKVQAYNTTQNTIQVQAYNTTQNLFVF